MIRHFVIQVQPADHHVVHPLRQLAPGDVEYLRLHGGVVRMQERRQAPVLPDQIVDAAASVPK